LVRGPEQARPLLSRGVRASGRRTPELHLRGRTF
jgi:hypothetical protein